MLNGSREEYESSLKKQESELNRLKVKAQLVTDVRANFEITSEVYYILSTWSHIIFRLPVLQIVFGTQ